MAGPWRGYGADLPWREVTLELPYLRVHKGCISNEGKPAQMANSINIFTSHDVVTDTVFVHIFDGIGGDEPEKGRIFMNANTGIMTFQCIDGKFDPVIDLPVLNIFDFYRIVLKHLYEHVEEDDAVPFMIDESIVIEF